MHVCVIIHESLVVSTRIVVDARGVWRFGSIVTSPCLTRAFQSTGRCQTSYIFRSPLTWHTITNMSVYLHTRVNTNWEATLGWITPIGNTSIKRMMVPTPSVSVVTVSTINKSQWAKYFQRTSDVYIELSKCKPSIQIMKHALFKGIFKVILR